MSNSAIRLFVRSTPVLLAFALLASPAAASAPEKHCSDQWCKTTAHELVDDHLTICASVLQHWSNLHVTGNDTLNRGTKITDFGQPANGEARLVATDGFNRLEYRDRNANGTYLRYYEVHFPNGSTAHAFWEVTADRSC